MHAHRNTQRRAQKPPYYCCRHAWELWHKRQTNSMTHPLSHREESCLAKWKPSNQLICLWAFENTCFWCHRQYLHCLFSHFCSIFFMLFQQLCHNWTASVLSEVMNKYKLYARLCVSFCLSVGMWVCVWEIKFQSKPLQNPTDFCDRPSFQTLSSFQFAY